MTALQEEALRLVAKRALALSTAMADAEDEHGIDFDDYVEEEWIDLTAALEGLRIADSEAGPR